MKTIEEKEYRIDSKYVLPIVEDLQNNSYYINVKYALDDDKRLIRVINAAKIEDNKALPVDIGTIVSEKGSKEAVLKTNYHENIFADKSVDEIVENNLEKFKNA